MSDSFLELLDMQFWANIYSSESSSDDCLPTIRSLLSCPTNITVARSFQGDEAQRLIDFLDRVSEPRSPCFNKPRHSIQSLARLCFDNKLRKRCLRLLSKICKAHRIVPTSYVLQRDLIHVGRVRCYGGSADVSDGEYKGGLVAIKCLKVNEGDLNGVFRVCILEQLRGSPWLTLHPAFLSRNHLLEAFVPPQHSTFVGRFGVHKPALFLHPLRVDAQRKCHAIHEIKSRGKPPATGKLLLLFPRDFSYFLST
jgi:hypothetical protein